MERKHPRYILARAAEIFGLLEILTPVVRKVNNNISSVQCVNKDIIVCLSLKESSAYLLVAYFPIVLLVHFR